MKRLSIATIGIIGVLLIAWVLYPAEISAKSYAGKQLSGHEYAQIKHALFLFADVNKFYSITARGDRGPQGTVALYCRGIPLVVVTQAPTVTLVQVFSGATRRAPGIMGRIEYVLSKIDSADQAASLLEKDSINGIEKFVLKHRDGIDLDKTCTAFQLRNRDEKPGRG